MRTLRRTAAAPIAAGLGAVVIAAVVAAVLVEPGAGQTAVAGVAAVGAVSTAAAGLGTAHLATGPVVGLERDVAAIADGDESRTLPTDRDGPVGEVARSVETLRTALVECRRERDRYAEKAQARRDEVEAVEATAEAFAAVARETDAGDLSRRMDPNVSNESMAALAGAFNETMADIEETTERLDAVADAMAAAARSVTDETTTVESASEQVTRSVETISDGAERQHTSLSSVAAEMNDLSTTIEEIAASANEVADLAERTAVAGGRGREAADRAIAGIEEIESVAETAIADIDRLAEAVGEIDELIDYISDVAEQTNMLALNANIEAARAGSGGDDGFGAVAEEVKALATDTKSAAEDVEERLERIRARTDETVSTVRAVGDEVTGQRESIRQAATALDEIATLAEETNDGVQEISAATEQQAASAQEIVAAVDVATEIAERTSGAADDVAAAAADQTRAMHRIAGRADELAGQATELDRLLGRTETEAGLDAAASADGDWDPAAEPVSRQGQPDEKDGSAGADAEAPSARTALSSTAGGADAASDSEPADGPGSVEAAALRQAVIDAYPGDEPPWHAMARIQLKTGYDLETVEPGEELAGERCREVLEAASEVTGEEIEL